MELDQTLHKVELVKQEHNGRLRSKEAENELQRKHMHLLQENEVKFYQQMKELGADVTQIMVAQQRNPDKLIQIVNDKDKRGDQVSSANVRFVNEI